MTREEALAMFYELDKALHNNRPRAAARVVINKIFDYIDETKDYIIVEAQEDEREQLRHS